MADRFADPDMACESESFWEGRERDAPLSLRWETRDVWEPIALALGIDNKPRQTAAVVLALYAEATGRSRPVSYSRSKAHYDRPKRYRSGLYTHRSVVGAVTRLDEQGLIRNCIAEPGQRGWQSSMEAEPDLIAAVSGIVGQTDLSLAPPTELVRLKDADKRLLDYADTRETCRMRRELQAQNEAIDATVLGGPIDLRSHLHRIFNNGDFGQGGRFYAEGGAYQSLPKAERAKLTIDGEPVVEIDYSELHPVLAYAECGRPFPGEAYDLPGYPRGLVKVAVAIMLNSSSPSGARHTLAHKPGMATVVLGDRAPDADISSVVWGQLTERFPGYAQAAHAAAEKLIERLRKKHEAIRSLFFTSSGTRLQRLDSDIAEAVMRRMRRQGIVVLPVHDSFLVQVSKATDLEAAMVEEAERAGVNVICKRSLDVSVG